jgi:hypothetical protein
MSVLLPTSSLQLGADVSATGDLITSQVADFATGVQDSSGLDASAVKSSDAPRIQHAPSSRARRAASRQTAEAKPGGLAVGLTGGATFPLPTFDSLHDARCYVVCAAFAYALALDAPGAIRWVDVEQVLLFDMNKAANGPRVRVYA